MLLALWILLGLFLWPQFIGGDSEESGPCVVPWELEDSNDNIIASSDATINFAKSTATIQSLDSELKTALDKIAKYLKDNTTKNITIEGYFDKDEKPASGTLRDLAVARANVVKSMFTKKGVSPNQLAIIAKRYKDEEKSQCIDDKLLNRGVSFSYGREKGSE